MSNLYEQITQLKALENSIDERLKNEDFIFVLHYSISAMKKRLKVSGWFRGHSLDELNGEKPMFEVVPETCTVNCLDQGLYDEEQCQMMVNFLDEVFFN